jgi:hypothetical protein
MDCPICNSLLLAYKVAIKLYVDAEVNIAESSLKLYRGDDYKAALEEAERLRLACQDASDAFMEHWQEDHNVNKMAASA